MAGFEVTTEVGEGGFKWNFAKESDYSLGILSAPKSAKVVLQ